MADQHVKADEIKQPETYGMPHGGMYWGYPHYPGTGSHMYGCPGCGGGQHHWWHGHHQPWGYHHTWWGHHQPWWGQQFPTHYGQQWGGYPGGSGWKRDDE